MSHKIRNAMKKRDEGYQLSGYMEMDESFFGSPSEGEGKCGRGTDKAPVVIGLSLDEAGHPEFVKAKVLGTLDSESIVDFAHSAVEESSSIASDGLSIYKKLAEKGYIHFPENFNAIENPEYLKWLHIVISNLKSFINGTYHDVAKIHLQTFLDEFCYRFNRRFWSGQLFARTLFACSCAPPFTRYDLIG